MAASSALTMTLAAIIAGEAGMLGLPAQIDLGQVAVNRLEAGMGFDGWYAWDDVTPGALMAARLALRLPDRTRGAMYALSRDDIRRLGFREGDIVHCGPSGLELHIFWLWPADEADGTRGEPEYPIVWPFPPIPARLERTLCRAGYCDERRMR